jgi:hypothetical protein
VSSSLSSVPVERRRRAAAAAGLLATLLVAIGVLPWVSVASAGLRVMSIVALIAGLTLALVSWGLLASAGADRAEARLDAAVASTIAGFDCGHDHDPDEMHVAGACPSGDACAHDCATCLSAAWRN